MATGSEYWTIPGLRARAAMTTYQYRVVRASTTAGYVELATAASDPILGVLQNDPAAGEVALVAYMGICKCIAGVADLNEGEVCTVKQVILFAASAVHARDGSGHQDVHYRG